MKFVYVLVSSPDDYYAEQAFLSIISLRKHDPDAEIFILSDNETADYLLQSNHQLLKYINELNRVSLPNQLSAIERSRYIKTSMRQYIKGDFLYLDSDTVICKKINDIKGIKNIGAVNEWHQKNITSSQLTNYLKLTEKEFWKNNRYFNGGVLYVKDTIKSYQFFELWHKLWIEDLKKFKISKDQPTLSLSNALMNDIIEELDDNYNCQLWSLNSFPFLYSAKIIHYQIDLVSRMGINFPFQDLKLLQKIRVSGTDSQINDIINFPQNAFFNNCKLIMGKEYSIFKSPMVTLALKLSRDFSWINKIARFVYFLFGYRI